MDGEIFTLRTVDAERTRQVHRVFSIGRSADTEGIFDKSVALQRDGTRVEEHDARLLVVNCFEVDEFHRTDSLSDHSCSSVLVRKVSVEFGRDRGVVSEWLIWRVLVER